jgi:hypothetical protein
MKLNISVTSHLFCLLSLCFPSMWYLCPLNFVKYTLLHWCGRLCFPLSINNVRTLTCQCFHLFRAQLRMHNFREFNSINFLNCINTIAWQPSFQSSHSLLLNRCHNPVKIPSAFQQHITGKFPHNIVCGSTAVRPWGAWVTEWRAEYSSSTNGHYLLKRTAQAAFAEANGVAKGDPLIFIYL